jgi:hypothetical protein
MSSKFDSRACLTPIDTKVRCAPVPPDPHVLLPTAALIGVLLQKAWRMIGSFTVRRDDDGLHIGLRIRPPYRR